MGILVKMDWLLSLTLLVLFVVIKLLHSIKTFRIVKKFTLMVLVRDRAVLE
jgi:hypothetical protein